MKYALQDKTGKETASVSFENGNVISLGGNVKVKDEAVSQKGYKTNIGNISEKPNRLLTWINFVHISNHVKTSKEGYHKPYLSGDKSYNSYYALFNSNEFLEALYYAKEYCESIGYTPVSEKEAIECAVNKRCGYHVVQDIPVLYKQIDEDDNSTNVLIGVTISSNRQTDIVVAFIVARNSKGNEKKVIVAKKIRVV